MAAIDREFDYLVPEEMARDVRVGTIVRIALRGRRVRGWVVEDGVEPEADPAELRPLAKVSSDGPPPEIVALTEWAAWWWAAPRSFFLKDASPPNVVTTPPPALGLLADTARRARSPRVGQEAKNRNRGPEFGHRVTVLRWAPAARMAELLRGLVAPEGSTIVVIPDVGRAHALGDYFRGAGSRAVVLDGTEPRAARTRAWVAAREGRCVVIGGRGVVWAPVPDLAAVVLVDDADEALKEERAPGWHARDVAVERARRRGVPVTIVSPAPSLEALALAGEVVAPSRPVEREGWGRVVAVDRRDDPPGSGMFSPEIVDPMRKAAAGGQGPSGPTERGGRVVCVLNRKGRARLLACGSCRGLIRCDVCGGAMAEDEGGLVCRTCGETRPRVCAVCGSTVLARLKPGIARMREELEALLPRVEVAEVGAAVEVPDAAVVVGTEAVLHRVDSAALVAFLDFDQELLAPRYRASEQALWLLVRAVRLTGPRGGGTVMVQTRMPDHEVVRAATAGDPEVVAEAERARRRALGYPPFGAIAEVEADAVALDALEGEDVTVLGGPVRFLVAAEDHETLAGALAAARRRGRLRAHVDPLRA